MAKRTEVRQIVHNLNNAESLTISTDLGAPQAGRDGEINTPNVLMIGNKSNAMMVGNTFLLGIS